MNLGKVLVIGILISLLISFFYFDLAQYLSFDFIKEKQGVFQQFYADKPFLSLFVFFLVYVASTALSIPGATILTLLGGALFGLGIGTLVISFASTIGASLAFLASRVLLRDFVQEKFAKYLKSINEGVEKEGAFYLFTLRLVPIFPFFVINLAMGLSTISLVRFYLVSQLGMLLGTLVYVNAGTQLGQLESVEGILSPALLFSFVLLGVFPFIAKFLVQSIKARQVYKAFDKPKQFDTNMVVLGAGAGGLVSSLIASAVGAKVTLIEAESMGGDCLNTGCVPSKALIRSAKIFHYIQKAEDFGLKAENEQVDFKKVMARVQQVIKDIEPHDSIERYTEMGVDCVTGYGKILSPYEVEVNGETIRTKNIVVATGARPFVPPIKDLNKVNFLTSDNVWQLESLPEKLVVLGGGPIGSELTQAFSRLGSKVFQVEMLPRILMREDEDVSLAVTERFKSEGISVLSNHKALSVEVNDGRKLLNCEFEGQIVPIEFDEILVAVGRTANSSGFGLEALGVDLNPNGTVQVDEYLQTKYPNILACGDVAGPYQFTHTAAHQAWYASVNALFGRFKKFKVDYSVIPWATFIDPEVARVGLNETDAKAQELPYEVTRYGIDDLDRAIADNEAHGFIKVLTVPGKDTILGVTIVGYHAAELLAEYVLAMKQGLGLNKILGTIHIYPTLSESNKYVAGEWKKAHKPEKVLSYLARYFEWVRS